jgi:uncharacterized protein (TIGR02145 family)
LIPNGEAALSFTDKTGAPGKLGCIPMTGNIDFTVSAIISKGFAASFEATTSNFMAPDVVVLIYTWSAPEFSPDTHSGAIYTPIAPAIPGTYPVMLTVSSEGYCDLTASKDVKVIDCIPSTVYGLEVSASSYCEGSAGVTFALSGTDSGNSYQLYRDDTAVGATLEGKGSPATFSGFFEAGTYTARTVSGGAFCPAEMNGSLPVVSNPNPTITLSSGSASQTLKQGAAIDVIKYTTTNATSASISELPSGVTGSWDSNTYTISGTISASAAVQTYNYTVSTTNNIGCPNATASGSIVVEDAKSFSTSMTGGPNTAATQKTWMIGTGSSAQTWSDRIVKIVCTNSATFTTSNFTTAEYKEYNGRYYYSWTCMAKNATVMCPDSWHVATVSDFNSLISNLGGNVPRAVDVISAAWGVGGFLNGSVLRQAEYGMYWALDGDSGDRGRELEWSSGGLFFWSHNKCFGFQVRCVK